jgi:[ribosomal protein S5]-alanine N-acetyltransferase
MELETARLLLRPPRLADATALFAFLGDAAAMQYTNHDPSLRATRQRIAVHERQRRRKGYAPWAVLAKADRTIVGWGGIYEDPLEPGWGVEVAYMLHPAAWGQGYASELVAACCREADLVLRLPELRAFTRPANAASRRVLEKNGFALVHYVPPLERLLYCRVRP